MTTHDSDTSLRYLLDISYIGKGFNGFQSQSDGSGIQDHLEKVLTLLLRKPIKLRGASRTDSGVHALAQKATFLSHKIPDGEKFLRSANALLPKGVCLKSLQVVPDSFDPMVGAKAKIYRYSLWFGFCQNPFLSPYVWQIPRRASRELFEKELKKFEGTHDFTSFCNSDSSAKTKVRSILKTHVDVYENSLDLWILGEGFLKQMIRIMVGTLVERSLGKKGVASIPELISLKDRKKAGQTAPAEGLTLMDIFYESPPELLSYIEEKKNRAFFYR